MSAVKAENVSSKSNGPVNAKTVMTTKRNRDIKRLKTAFCAAVTTNRIVGIIYRKIGFYAIL